MEKSNKQSLREIKQELDELEKKLKYSNRELKSTYKDHRKKFAALVRKVHDYVSEIEHSSHDKINAFKKKSKYLLDTLESDFDISYIDYNDKPQDLKKALEEFEHSLKDYYEETGKKAETITNKLDEDLHTQIDKFKHELSFYQAQFETAGKEKMEDFEQWKSKRLEDVKQLKGRIDVKLNSSREKVGKFNEEISEAYQHLKSAFSKLR